MSSTRSLITCICIITFCFMVTEAFSGQLNRFEVSQTVEKAGLALMAKKLNATDLAENRKIELSMGLMSLTGKEVLQLRKLWRAELIFRGDLTAEDADIFPILQQIDEIISEKAEKIFGEGATIFNLSQEEHSLLDEELLLDERILNLINQVERKSNKNFVGINNEAVLSSSSCYYDNNWPKWLSSTKDNNNSYKGGGVGRVKNDPNEWPCDFVIYIKANTYKRVTGKNTAAYKVVNYSGGLSASPSRDAVIVGYGRVLKYGIPTEDWVRNYILFKK